MYERFDKLAPGVPAKMNLALDAVVVALVLLTTWGWQPPAPMQDALAICGIAVIVWFCSAAVLRLYSPCTPRGEMDSFVLTALAVAATTCAAGIGHLLLFGDFTSFYPVSLAVGLYGISNANRILLFKPLARLSDPLEAVLIVGTGPMGAATYSRLAGQSNVPRRIVGFLRFPGQPATVHDIDRPVLGRSDQLLEVLSQFPVTEVYIAGSVTSQAKPMQAVVRICEEVGMPFALPLHSLRFERALLLSSSPARDGYLHYLTMKSRPTQYAMKRLVDIAASTMALLVLSPLLVGVAAAIKMTSRGPVLFRQVRVGLHGARFNLLKFRSMVADAEALQKDLLDKNEQTGPVFKMTNDPRITRIGHFIRKYSIDELPQLISILRGDMTIVGPRPALPKEVAQYGAWQRRRLSVRPGLTCLWQVSGRNEIGFDEWMRLDLQYVDNWSLALDMRLIMQTFPVVLAGRGAS